VPVRNGRREVLCAWMSGVGWERPEDDGFRSASPYGSAPTPTYSGS
jgi:hypothetical protein